MTAAMWGNLIGVVTVLTMAVFIGIWVWAWGKRHRKVFKRMSEIPMEDPPEGPAPSVVEPVPGEVADAAAHRIEPAPGEQPRGDRP
ncbi:MAG: cbb3-type cytochrome c oxidase subunit 3 [Rhodanobacter sp.]